jgi:ATP-dependent DNA helicase RecG
MTLGPNNAPLPFLARPLVKVFGDRTAKLFAAKLELHTVGDLLRHYPRRYVERGELTPLAQLREGDDVTVMASVKSVQSVPMRQRKGSVVKVVITDGSAELDVTFFAPKPFIERSIINRLTPGRRALFAGQVSSFRGRRQLSHPETQVLESQDAQDLGGAEGHEWELAEEYADAILPIYPAAAKLTTWKIAGAVRTLLDGPDLLALDDPLPPEVRERRGLMPLGAALMALHRPTSREEIKQAEDRVRYEEAFLLQVALAGRRAEVAAQPAIPRSGRDGGLLGAFDERLPFRLTDGQVQVSQAITDDLGQSHPMHRLLQGEVGSGKTVVALRAMLTVVDAGGQAALLAPTEVLAQQHHRSITQMMGDLAEGGMLGGHASGTRVRLLTGSLSTAARRQAMLDAASGDAGIVIGTHALLQERVEFFDLGLVVVDEQHRFGVEQRDALRAKADRPPHLLVMTATPIPRTVAMTVFGDLATSTLRELPSGRQPIVTHVVPADDERWIQRSWQRVREEVDKGHQVYVVCPRIGGEFASEDTMLAELEAELADDGSAEGAAAPRRPSAAALDTLDQLRADPNLAGARIEVLHGRLPPEVKDGVMLAFAEGAVDVLVATTVVEVGVDVANATTMVVLDADRFGVSQLHQLRGRVGRGTAPGLCLLVSSADKESPSWQRLSAVADTADGFELARVDLEYRREGDVLGAAQSGGRSSLRFLKVLRDEDVITRAREDAVELVARDPLLLSQPALLAALREQLDASQLDFLERG